eukprot:TRINITY_DN8418_c0_g1_i1.p1 TRINITY_DN8418_c0_g1~~TRINITY_DN8418_c0_g1_i1.p1  ORF type:complete len:544 (+),score=59.76 TRINITY_DN8418_c0_g1_i1:40-1671(+)
MKRNNLFKNTNTNKKNINNNYDVDLNNVVPFSEFSREVKFWRFLQSLFWFFVFILILSPFSWVLYYEHLFSGESIWDKFLILVRYLIPQIIMIIFHACLLRIPTTKNRNNLYFIISVIIFTSCKLTIISYLDFPKNFSLISTCVIDVSYDNGTIQTESVYCLNELMFLVVVYSLVISIVMSWYFIFEKNYILSFPMIQQERIWRLKARIPILITKALKYSTICIILTYLIYYLIGQFFSQLFIYFCHFFTTTNIYVYPNLYNNFEGLGIGHLFYSSLLSVFSWLFSIHLLQINYTQYISFDLDNKRYRFYYLLEALTKNDEIKYLAYLDLWKLSNFSTPRRYAIFSDDSGDTWNDIFTNCINNINQLTYNLTKAAQKQMDDLSFVDGNKNKLKKSFISKLKSFVSMKKYDNAWEYADPGTYRTELLFKQYQVVIWSIKILSNLIVAKDEDTYGLVQNSNGIFKGLGSFIDLLTAIENYKNADISFPPSKFDGFQLLDPQIYSVILALKTGIYKIVTTFYSELDQISIPPAYEKKLEAFINFRE